MNVAAYNFELLHLPNEIVSHCGQLSNERFVRVVAGGGELCDLIILLGRFVI
jgi:hypothetical protein